MQAVRRRECPGPGFCPFLVLVCCPMNFPTTSCHFTNCFSSQGPHKQSQNNARPFVAAAMEQQMIHTQSPLIAQPSAKDIQLLLSNIGAGHRASLPTIESMMRKNKADDADMSTVTANEMIDLIAQIRSI
mmetsp:Transcript_8472/g.18976  ORF Transcript_8472/g.18976 Transcript_8472/m.18976 type:complete len:130 (+) Transcript_8472:262-651(+)